MAANRQILSPRSRRDSNETTVSLWEKVYERSPQTKHDAPFVNNQNDDSDEENSIIDDNDNDASDLDASSSSISTTLATLNINKQSKPWINSTEQQELIIIINDQQNPDKVKQDLKRDFSKQGLTWTNEEEKLDAWHFGLTSLHLHFTKPRSIHIQMLCSSSSSSSRIPFWLTFHKEKQQSIPKVNKSQEPFRYKLSEDMNVGLKYGALTDLNHFYYSPQHSWTNQQDVRNSQDHQWFLFLDDQRNGGGYIEWVIQNPSVRQKKQLLLNNINHSVIIDSNEESSDIYICQHCNINEFEANGNNKNDKHKQIHTPRVEQDNSARSQGSSGHREQRSNSRSRRPRPPPLLRAGSNEVQRPQRVNYGYYRRIGVRAGCYFSTIHFSLSINRFRVAHTNTQKTQAEINKTLSLLIDFFLRHNITVCYGQINSQLGPHPHLFFQPNIPRFPSLIMKYSWQILSIVGYRLQLQINDQFIDRLFKLNETEKNSDELFYHVCVYLSRIFALKPFVNIVDELEHAVTQSKQKRDASAYGLVRTIDITEENEAYIPSVTLTPTTIRIKPLKLCRTNRVLRAIEQFGKPLYHFVLVDIRDENGRNLQSFHFGHLRQLLLDYLKDGFILMDDDRAYQYLHHSQSQLRGRQFWFYHHHIDDEDCRKRNLSFDEAYRWMGKFDKETNPAKYAARVALCFSTTKATVEVAKKNVVYLENDIEIKTNGKVLTFTDGCGTMSEWLRNEIQQSLNIRNKFSAVQFRYAGNKGVVSVDTRLKNDKHLFIRPSMTKFQSDHHLFEVCKVSAPRPLFLNRQAILLLSYRQISPVSFLILQQQYHLHLLRALLRNSDAEKLILEKVPFWFLPKDIHIANIDYIREPFFRQLLISACLQSTRDLLYRTRIRIPRNTGRNMMGIVDEYNVLKPDEVFIQYTLLDRDSDDEKKTIILDHRQVVITKNPCHHPGDIRTFTAVNHPSLKHLKDVIVFSQQGDRPAPHDISGSDLDGDEYLVIWHEDLVPTATKNAEPYDYDSQIPIQEYDQLVTRDDINNIILEIAEQDCLGRLSNLHLAFADEFGVDNDKRPAENVLSAVELAGAISQEVDSGKTGYHPLKEDDIKRLNNALQNTRPDYMDNPNFEPRKSKHILGKLYRASKKTLPGWNRLVRYHRYLRHLQVRTRDEPEEDENKDDDDDDDDETNNNGKTDIHVDSSLIPGVDRDHPGYHDCVHVASQLLSVYRQEILEILSLYGLSHESDLWCRNSINNLSGELEDTAYTELEQLVTRTRSRFFFEWTVYCDGNHCHDDTPVSDLCGPCRKRQSSIAVACYCVCYGEEHASEQAPIFSMPWLFATSLLHNRIAQPPSPPQGSLAFAMQKKFQTLWDTHRLRLDSLILQFKTSNTSCVGEGDVDVSVCVFIEILQKYLERKNYSYWPLVLSRFVRNTPSFKLLSKQYKASDEWELVLKPHDIHKYDEYACLLKSMLWTESEDKLMHDYFEDILEICFDESRRTNATEFLHISEDIILLLQELTINQTIF